MASQVDAYEAAVTSMLVVVILLAGHPALGAPGVSSNGVWKMTHVFVEVLRVVLCEISRLLRLASQPAGWGGQIDFSAEYIDIHHQRQRLPLAKAALFCISGIVGQCSSPRWTGRRSTKQVAARPNGNNCRAESRLGSPVGWQSMC